MSSPESLTIRQRGPKSPLHPVEAVRQRYLRAGAGMPQQLGERAFTGFLAELDDLQVAAPRLRGILHYERGICRHADRLAEAAFDFEKAAYYFGRSSKQATKPDTVIRRATQAEINRLMLARTSAEERRIHAARVASAQRLGRLIMDYTATSLSRFSPGASHHVYGALIETAIVGTLAVHNRFFGVPCTERQDWAFRRTLAENDTVLPAAATPNMASDLNVFAYEGDDPRPTLCGKVQVKSRDHDQSGDYAEDIMVIYGDRELYVSDEEELYVYGSQLAAYEGKQTDPLRIACSNIDLAYELRDRHFYTWAGDRVGTQPTLA